MLNRSAIWIESTKTKMPLPLGKTQFDYAAFIIQSRKAPTMYSRSTCTICWEDRYIKGTKTTFSVLFYALVLRVLRRCICWRFHNVRAKRSIVMKFQFLKTLSRWSVFFFLLRTSFELKILEHIVKIGSCLLLRFRAISPHRQKKCTNFKYV